MEKMTFRQKVENFWYHNKFTTIVVSVFAIFIIIATVQLFTKKEPDANFLYMGPGAVAFSGEALMQESIAEVMKEDYNKDGEKYVDYIELTALDTDKNFDDTEGDFATGYTSAQVQKTVGETFAAHIIAGDSMIYLIDDSFFNVAKDTGVLMPLKEALGYTPDIAVNEYAVYLSDLDIYYMPGFNLFPESTMLCIRYPVTLTSGKAEVENRERCNISVFKDMLSYVYPDKPVEIVRPDPVVTSLEDFKIMLKDYSEEKKLSISEDLTPNEIKKVFEKERYSRLPVYRDNIDSIIGFIHEKDFYRVYTKKDFDVKKIMQEVIFVVEHTKISALLKKLQKNKVHMAIVLVEYGGTLGIVTVEDIIEELVGEIYDEHDEEFEPFKENADGSVTVNCLTELDVFFEKFDIIVDEDEESDANTVGGWVSEKLGELPTTGKKFSYRNLDVTVSKTTKKKVLEIKVTVNEEVKDEEE